MRKKKIDDNQLLSLLKSGKNQKEAAAILGVSAPAVTKRLRRLRPMPESLKSLSLKEQRFVVEVAKGATQTRAALSAFDCGSLASGKAIGSQLMARAEVREALNDLLELHLPQSYRIKRLREHTDHSDPAVSLRALDLSWKLDGSFAPEKHLNLTAAISPVDMSKYMLQPSKEESEE